MHSPYSPGFHPPSYSPQEIEALRIRRVHFLDDRIFIQLSDGRVLSVPVSLSPKLAVATEGERYQWQLVVEGRGVVWYVLEEHLSIKELLAHPDARIGTLPAPP